MNNFRNETFGSKHVKKKTVNTLLSIDSKFRKDYFKTDPANFSVKLSVPFKNVLSMKLSSLELTNSIYTISDLEGTNIFKITSGVGSTLGQGETTIRLPTGNYQSNTLKTAVNEQFTNFQTSNNDKPFSNIEINIDTVSGRCIIARTDLTNGDPFELDFTNTTKENAPPMMSLGWLLGFRNIKYKGKNKYVSECLVDLAGPKYFYFCINDFQKSVNQAVLGVYENSFLSKNILARILIREGKYIVLFDDGSDTITKKREYFGPVNIERLHIELINEYGHHININNQDFSFALELEVQYEY